MKLIYCQECGDMVKLSYELRECKCSHSSGRYLNELEAIYRGAAIPIGIENNSFVGALRNRPKIGLGKKFQAFVIPEKCPTFWREDD